ncbi:MAG: hypothetical protein ACPGGH_08350 [Chitinophagales bacterium]
MIGMLNKVTQFGCLFLLACLVQCKEEPSNEERTDDAEVAETPTSRAGDKLVAGEALDKYDIIAIAEHIRSTSPEVITTPLIEVGIDALATMTPALDSFTVYDFQGAFDETGNYLDSTVTIDLLPAQQAVFDYLSDCREKNYKEVAQRRAYTGNDASRLLRTSLDPGISIEYKSAVYEAEYVVDVVGKSGGLSFNNYSQMQDPQSGMFFYEVYVGMESGEILLFQMIKPEDRFLVVEMIPISMMSS